MLASNDPEMDRAAAASLAGKSGGEYRSPEILRWLVPGQISFDNAVTAWNNQDYALSGLWTMAMMLAEQTLYVLSFCESTTASLAVRGVGVEPLL